MFGYGDENMCNHLQDMSFIFLNLQDLLRAIDHISNLAIMDAKILLGFRR